MFKNLACRIVGHRYKYVGTRPAIELPTFLVNGREAYQHYECLRCSRCQYYREDGPWCGAVVVSSEFEPVEPKP